MSEPAVHTITEVTRRNIIDAITIGKIPWWGRMEETDFLSRLYDLEKMPSTDRRYKTAYQDVWKHREMNKDWEDDWIFSDSRFNLFRASDEELLRFLCEMAHPAVRPDEEDVALVVKTLNSQLIADGWELAACGEISGKPVFAARRLLEGAGAAVKHARNIADVLVLRTSVSRSREWKLLFWTIQNLP
jgi:hypothetical protein